MYARLTSPPTIEAWQIAGARLLEQDPKRFGDLLTKVEEILSIYTDPLDADLAAGVFAFHEADPDNLD